MSHRLPETRCGGPTGHEEDTGSPPSAQDHVACFGSVPCLYYGLSVGRLLPIPPAAAVARILEESCGRWAAGTHPGE